MSFTELKERVAQLNPAELAELREVIDADGARPAVRRATPEMLAEGRRLMDQVLTGEWSADLPPWQETRALDQAHDRWNKR
jgi:DNA-binding GntR family transcriptional regulator